MSWLRESDKNPCRRTCRCRSCSSYTGGGSTRVIVLSQLPNPVVQSFGSDVWRVWICPATDYAASEASAGFHARRRTGSFARNEYFRAADKADWRFVGGSSENKRKSSHRSHVWRLAGGFVCRHGMRFFLGIDRAVFWDHRVRTGVGDRRFVWRGRWFDRA